MNILEKTNNWRYDGDIEYVNICVLCSSELFETDAIFSEKLDLIPPFSCKKCLSCGLRWLSPRPTQKGYELIYTKDNYFGDGTLSPENFSCLEKNRKLLFQNRLQKISKYLPKNNYQKTILDIGAATGSFVYEANLMGYKAIGIELSPDAREEAKKKYSIELQSDTIDDLLYKKYKFDIIHMNHVFEHFLHPDKCLQSCHDLLDDNGLIVIEIPQQFNNDIDRLKRIFRTSKRNTFNPYSLHHTYFYNINTITRLIENQNFKICHLTTNTSLNKKYFKNLLLSIFIYLSDCLHKGGSTIEIFARK